MKSRKRRKKRYNTNKVLKALNREEEIKKHGKLISFRPTKVMKSGKEYKRNKKVEIYEDN